MSPLENVTSERKRVRAETTQLLKRIQGLSSAPNGGIAALIRIRREASELLNQLPHESSILDAVEWFRSKRTKPDDRISWLWNPRQTGNKQEPDLRGLREDEIVVSAEVTTSPAARGVLASRMKSTLEKLAGMQGHLYYFVLTEPMRQSAERVIKHKGWPIKVIVLSPP